MRGGRDERDDAVAPTARWRTVGLAVGALLAVGATVVVFLTDDARVLRLAVVGAAWAFVLALLVTGRARPPAEADPGRAQLERAHEVVGRRQEELASESRRRRESDDATRAELAALRHDVAALAALRQDVAALGGLRQDVAALGGLRQDVAALAALRQDVAALGALRQDVAALGALRQDVTGPGGLREEVARLAAMRAELGQLTDLRADLGRLRTELTEQLSSEMLMERVVMRTQSSRGPTGPAEGPGTRSIEAVSWTQEAPPELSGGWAAAGQDPLPAAPATRGYDALQRTGRERAGARPHREPATDPALPVAGAPPGRRRTDEPQPVEQLTVERPAAAPQWRGLPASDLEAWPRPPAPLPDEDPVQPLTVQAPGVPVPGEARLAQILAENGASPGGRRRHRYRDDDEDDDVLARVLRRS
jgi:hypothetical protein